MKVAELTQLAVDVERAYDESGGYRTFRLMCSRFATGIAEQIGRQVIAEKSLPPPTPKDAIRQAAEIAANEHREKPADRDDLEHRLKMNMIKTGTNPKALRLWYEKGKNACSEINAAILRRLEELRLKPADDPGGFVALVDECHTEPVVGTPSLLEAGGTPRASTSVGELEDIREKHQEDGGPPYPGLTLLDGSPDKDSALPSSPASCPEGEGKPEAPGQGPTATPPE